MATQGTFLYRDYVRFLDGDILSALLLSQLVYWCLPTDHGKPKLRVFRDGVWWVAKSHRDWDTELGLSRMQTRRCLDVLRQKGLIQIAAFCFNGAPTAHVRLSVAQGARMIKVAPTLSQLASIGCQQPMEEGIGCQQRFCPGRAHQVRASATLLHGVYLIWSFPQRYKRRRQLARVERQALNIRSIACTAHNAETHPARLV